MGGGQLQFKEIYITFDAELTNLDFPLSEFFIDCYKLGGKRFHTVGFLNGILQFAN